MIEIKEVNDIELLTEFFKDPYVEKYHGVTEYIAEPGDGFYFLGAFLGERLIGVLLCYNLTNILLEAHVCTKKEAFGYGREIFKKGFEYIFNNLCVETVMGRIPELYKPCIKIAEGSGMIFRGAIPKASLVNGRKCDLLIYSISSEEFV